MKLIKITTLALVAGYLISGTGCTRKIDEFGDINLNPGIVAEPNTAALLTNALSGMGDESWSVTAGLYSQLYSETQYTEASRYQRATPSFGGYYSGVLYDLVNIIKYNSNPETASKAAANGSANNQIATARILKAWWFMRVTDAWGNIPYFQALNFNGQIPYDSQELIYQDLFKELEEAVGQFDGGLAFKGDILLHGDIGAWKKFANSIRMIMAIRLAYIDAASTTIDAKQEFLDAMNHPAGYLTNNTDDIMLVYPGGNYPSTFYEYYNITLRFDYAISKTVTDHMNANGDLRINAWGSSNVGFPYGYERNDAITFSNANPNWARIMSDAIRTENQPMPILTSSQVTLARAEAAQRTWLPIADAPLLYKTGIELNWRQWGVYNSVAFTAYMADPDILLVGSELEKIITQRWLAAFPDGKEAWNIYRSTRIPDLTPAPGTNLEIPNRYGIAQIHYDLNNTNTNAIAITYTIAGEKDSQYALPWWVKPL